MSVPVQPISCAYVAGPHFVVYEFPSKEAAAQFKNEIAQMNQIIDKLNLKAQKAQLSREEIASELMVFYTMLSAFQDNFGPSVIPPDLLAAAIANNEVLSSCGWDVVPVPKEETSCRHPPKHEGCRVLRRHVRGQSRLDENSHTRVDKEEVNAPDESSVK